MKIDFDSILYIVITIVILVISALGSRKKKRLQQVQGHASRGTDAYSTDARSADTRKNESYPSDNLEPVQIRQDPVLQQPASPLERLEQILSGQVPRFESMEGESIESIVDEEEQIMEDLRKNRMDEETEKAPEGSETVTEEYEKNPEEMDAESLETMRREKEDLSGLFGSVDDVKKAIIYSEILKRKNW